MTELDQVWTDMLANAAATAHVAGRTHVAEYLRLKATNDAIRSAGVGWLFDTLIDIATREQATRYNIAIERTEPHRFDRGSSTMVGSRVTVRQGVRCLTLEAGWVRTPADGIMQKGALAFAQLSHFGIPKAASEFRLAFADPLPQWIDEAEAIVDSAYVGRHVDLLLSS